MLGTTTDPANQTEYLLWIRVLGDPAIATTRRAAGFDPASRPLLQVPALLLQTALGARERDPAEKEAALAVLATRIGTAPRQLRAFLATDARLIAQAIVRFDHAADSLRELRGRYADARVTGKIDQIIAELVALNSTR